MALPVGADVLQRHAPQGVEPAGGGHVKARRGVALHVRLYTWADARTRRLVASASVVAIHNIVNERAWREVLAWEALHRGCACAAAGGRVGCSRLLAHARRCALASADARNCAAAASQRVRLAAAGALRGAAAGLQPQGAAPQPAGLQAAVRPPRLGGGPLRAAGARGAGSGRKRASSTCVAAATHAAAPSPRPRLQVRYVIDFYNASPEPGKFVGMHLDVRPALDSPQALLDRLRMQARWVLAGAQPQQDAAPQRAAE